MQPKATLLPNKLFYEKKKAEESRIFDKDVLKPI